MLRLAVSFLVVASIAALLGFGGLVEALAGVGQALFFAFVVLFVVAMVVNASRNQAPRL
jgi:uncharacterized membrane protein YtjA (UPF0391 family)